MKRIIVLIIAIFTISIANAQQHTFSKVFYTNTDSVQAYSIVTTYDHNLIIVGEINNIALVLKMDKVGNIIWNKRLGVKSILYSIVNTNDSCFVIAGTIYNSINLTNDILCVKINVDGDTIWSKAIDMGYNDYANTVQLTNDNAYIISGYSQLTPTSSRIAVAKLDSTGNLLWCNTYAGGLTFNCANTIKQMPDSSYILTGYVSDSSNTSYYGYAYYSKPFLMNLTTSGAINWSKTASYFISGIDVAITPNGLLCYLVNEFENKTIVLKTDFTGNVLWSNIFNLGGVFPPLSVLSKICNTSDSCYVIVLPYEYSPILASTLMKFTKDGNLLLTKGLSAYATAVIETEDKGLMIVGNGPIIMYVTKSPTTINPQIGIIKTDSVGNGTSCVLQSSVSQVPIAITMAPSIFTTAEAGLVNSLHLIPINITLDTISGCVNVYTIGGVVERTTTDNLSIYPNPTKDNLTIETNLNKEQRLEIINLIGQTVYTNIINNKKATVNTSAFAKGVYILKLSSDKETVVRKFVKE